MNTRTNECEEKAVSEVIGYVIIVGIIFTSIGMVYMNAIPALQDSQEHERVNNVEKTFSVLQNNLNEIVERNIPSRGTEIRLTDSTVQTDDTVYVNATIYQGSEPSLNDSDMAPLNPITNEVSDEEVIYENGAVFRGDGSRYAMVYEPRWVIEEDFSIIHSVLTRGDDGNSITGSGTVLILGSSTDESSELGENKKIRITIDSPRASAWENYFDRLENTESVDFNESGGVEGMNRTNMTVDPNDKVIHVRNEMGVEVRR